MSTQKENLLALTANVLAKSAGFAERIRGLLPSILCDVGYYSNDAFFLRSYVSLRTDNEGDELAMTVDITAPSASDANSTVSIASDVCLDDGTIAVSGPSATLGASTPGFEAAISSWNNEFDEFLKASEVDVLNVLQEMLSKKNKVSKSLGGI
jgi:hypothetical protein